MEIAPWRIRSLTKLVYSQPFELLIAFVILINATSLAILTMPDLDPQVRDACEQIDLICFAIYGAELSRSWRRSEPMGASIFPLLCIHRRIHSP